MLKLVDEFGREVILERYGRRLRLRFRAVNCRRQRCGGCPHVLAAVYWRDAAGKYHDRIVGAVAKPSAGEGTWST